MPNAELILTLTGGLAAAIAIVLALRYPPRVALAVAIALAQIGEFSFILASLGIALKVLSKAFGEVQLLLLD